MHSRPRFQVDQHIPESAVRSCETLIAIVDTHLKLMTNELVTDVCSQTSRITGTTGYRNDSNYSVTRHLRDAHPAALMTANESIHAAIGALHLVYRDEAL